MKSLPPLLSKTTTPRRRPLIELLQHKHLHLPECLHQRHNLPLLERQHQHPLQRHLHDFPD